MGSGFRLAGKITVDIGMTVSLLFLMPYSMIGETAHEWIGILMFALFVIHHVLNRRWLMAVGRGKYTCFRMVQTFLVVAMLILMMGSMVSGIILSNHLFKAVKLKGFSMEARRVHMFCAYWGFLIMSVHLGMHWNMVIAMMGRLFQKPSTVRKWLVRTAGFGVAGYGAYAFYKRQIGDYLLMKMHFVFYDYTEKTIFFMADYLAIMIFMAMAGYYMGKWLKGKNKRVSQKAVGGRAQ